MGQNLNCSFRRARGVLVVLGAFRVFRRLKVGAEVPVSGEGFAARARGVGVRVVEEVGAEAEVDDSPLFSVNCSKI